VAEADAKTGVELKQRIVDRARSLGFDAVRVTRAELAPEVGAKSQLPHYRTVVDCVS
jgi:hypothetical protein